jgi:hypothetical protein
VSLERLKKSDAWRKTMTAYIDVRRVWGPIGLLWALLIDRLEKGKPALQCDRCGRPLEGTRRKRLCGPRDDPKCYKARRAEDRRRERIRETR